METIEIEKIEALKEFIMRSIKKVNDEDSLRLILFFVQGQK
jgi:hypothetical protein